MLSRMILDCCKRSCYRLLQRLEKQLESERQVSARHAEEIETLHQTIKQLTTALAQGSSTASADANITWAEIVSENHRLRADKSSLVYRLNDVQTSLIEENKQLSKMVEFSDAFEQKYAVIDIFVCIICVCKPIYVSFTSQYSVILSCVFFLNCL